MAAAFFQSAAYGGIIEAAYNLGLILENGLLGEVRAQDALIWYRGAADQGNVEAAQALENLANSMEIDVEQAGFLENGESLAQYLIPIQSLEPAAGGNNAVMAKPETVDLGRLIPTEDQILVAQIQEQLRKSGLYTGPQDGVVGEATVNAIREFQRSNELDPSGLATPELLTFMLQQGTG
jgi:localization factor PodJL